MTTPAPEPVEVAEGGSTDWGAMTPGQRVTFIQWARQRGYEPCGSFSYFDSSPPSMCQVDPVAAGLANPVLGVATPLPGNLNPWLWAAIGLLLLAVVVYAGGKTARRFAPI